MGRMFSDVWYRIPDDRIAQRGCDLKWDHHQLNGAHSADVDLPARPLDTPVLYSQASVHETPSLHLAIGHRCHTCLSSRTYGYQCGPPAMVFICVFVSLAALRWLFVVVVALFLYSLSMPMHLVVWPRHGRGADTRRK